MPRPEASGPPANYYDATEAAKYTSSSRIIRVQAEIAARCVELLNFPAGARRLVVDVGCGSGLSGAALERAGHAWVGCDVSRDMLRVAARRAARDDDGGEALEADGSKRDAMVRTALVTLEWKATGKVRRMEDVLHPTRMDAGDHLAAIRAGFVGRAVPGYVSDAALIAPDLREKANRCYPPSSTEDAMTVALATLAWDDFDHVMRRAFPLAAWSATAEAVVARAATLLAGVTDFDTRLNAPDHAEAWSTVRVDATTPTHAWHVVWASSNVELGKACVRARLHPRRVCLLAELETGKVTRVEA